MAAARRIPKTSLYLCRWSACYTQRRAREERAGRIAVSRLSLSLFLSLPLSSSLSLLLSLSSFSPSLCQQVWRANGYIDDCGKIVGGGKEAMGWFDTSTLKEPYRIEGKKTMGLELAEQFGFDVLPDVILYPTGGGTGLIGMWKAFEELELLGLRPKGAKKPRMVRGGVSEGVGWSCVCDRWWCPNHGPCLGAPGWVC
jgi:hypothetical protein